MQKLDVTKLNIAVDRLLEKTDNPRHRFLLMAYARHRLLEVAGRYKEIFTPEMTVGEPVYHFKLGTGDLILNGEDRVKSVYSMWAQTHQSIFYVEDEEVAVSDHCVFSIGGVVYQQVSGRSIRSQKWLSRLPKAIAKRLLERVLDEEKHEADLDDMYLYKTIGLQMIWPYDDRGRLIGEDVYEPRVEESELIKIDRKDVLTTEASGRLLSPLIQPLPDFDEVMQGRSGLRAA